MRNKSKSYIIGMIMSILIGMVVTACADPAPTETEPAQPATESAPTEAETESSTLQTVLDRGRVICVGNQSVPGFGFLEESGEFSGFDIDLCKAVAAAIFGDAEAYEIRSSTTEERFNVLQSGDADVVFRNTTWTLTRDTDLGSNFGPITFYDGQGIIVRKESGLKALKDLNGSAICVLGSTTSELNLIDQMGAAGVEYEAVVLATIPEMLDAYNEGRCDAITNDKSGLVAFMTTLADPAAHEIMDVTLSKEPHAPIVRHGDDQWYDIITWVTFVTFAAEEMGITSKNIDDFMDSEDPNVRKLLGLEGDFGQKLGLDNKWAVNVITQVGSYKEIYDRNLGCDCIFNLPRGLNSLYSDGGLLYAPPIR